MRNNRIQRVQRAKFRRQIRESIQTVIRQVAEAIVSILFLVTLGYLVGIGFGIGLVMMYLWI